MRKSIILASLLFASSAFAVFQECQSLKYDYYSSGGGCVPHSSGNFPLQCSIDPSQSNQKAMLFPTGDGDCGVNMTECWCSSSCVAPKQMIDGICRDPNECASPNSFINGACNPPPPPDPNHPLGEFDGDEDGCNGAGGYYMANTKCNTLGEAVKDIYSSPTAVAGAFLTIGGAIIGSAGMASTPITGPFGGGVAGVGAWATGVGLGMMGISGANKMFNATPSTSNDVTNGTQRIKLSLKDVSGGSASVVTNTSTTTKKVDSVTYIPPSVKAEMAKPEYANKTTGDLAKPLPMDGVQTTTYNYTTNKATTTTHEAGSTSKTPITSTRITNITTTSNSDGSFTTVPSDSTIAPIVSGSSGGSVSSFSTTWGTGTGTTSGTGTGTTSGNGLTKAELIDVLNTGVNTPSIPSNGNFDSLGTDDLTSLEQSGTSFIDNVKGQIDSMSTVYNSTQNIINNGWGSSVSVPSGSCGAGMQLNFHGKNVDLCPPLSNFLGIASPVVSLLVTISGIAFSIAIFIGGF